MVILIRWARGVGRVERSEAAERRHRSAARTAGRDPGQQGNAILSAPAGRAPTVRGRPARTHAKLDRRPPLSDSLCLKTLISRHLAKVGERPTKLRRQLPLTHWTLRNPMPSKAYRKIAEYALAVSLALLAAAGCSRGASADGPASPAASSFPSAAQSSIPAGEAAPKAGAPAWCGTLDSPAVTGLPGVLPQLVSKHASAAAPKVHAAAEILRHAAASAPAGPGQLLTVAAGSLDTAAGAKSAASLKDVATAFTALGKGVQGTCGFH